VAVEGAIISYAIWICSFEIWNHKSMPRNRTSVADPTANSADTKPTNPGSNVGFHNVRSESDSPYRITSRRRSFQLCRLLDI